MSAARNHIVLFDLDGTLIDSAPGVAWSLNRALAAEGRGPLSVERVKDLVGKGAHYLVADALEDTGGIDDAGHPDRVRETFLQIYSENPIQDTLVFPGAMDALDTLRSDGVPMALCTNKPRKTTLPVLDAFGLTKYFPVMLCGDDVENRKPDGRHVLDTIARMNVPGAPAVMVGDSENDIRAAHDASVPSICVSFGYCHVPFEELKPTVLIDSYDAFPGALADVLRDHFAA